MSFRCRRCIAFYDVDRPRGIFARVSSSVSRVEKAILDENNVTLNVLGRSESAPQAATKTTP